MRSEWVKVGSVVFFITCMLLWFRDRSHAFHSGGVGECSGCHSMHTSSAAGSSLLIGSDASSTCLTCHMQAGLKAASSFHVATADADMSVGTAPIQRTPGGDFGWLKKTYNFTVGGMATVEDGASHGHNIVAQDATFIADPANTTAPGGSFSSSQLGCTSCHDPHGTLRRTAAGDYVRPTPGQAADPIIASGSYDTSVAPGPGQAVGAFRLLRGMGDSSVPGITFTGVAIAIAPSTYNQSEAASQVRVAYGSSGVNTWGNWCASCHTETDAGNTHTHPSDRSLGSGIADVYNAYKQSGDLTGSAATSFTSLVPFAEKTDAIGTLQSHANSNNSYLNGPAISDQVTCLSCHRAHASGWPGALRWNMESEFMIYNGLFPGTDTTPSVPQFARGRLSAETQAAYYDRPVTTFANYQRVLCNKCHARD